MFLMPVNGPYPGMNDQKLSIFTSIVLNFLSLFQIYNLDSFGDLSHKNRFIEKMVEYLAVWIDFTLARFDRLARSLQQGVAPFYAEYNGILGNFLPTIINDLYTNKVNLPNEKRFTCFARS